jgi:cytochrome c55X
LALPLVALMWTGAGAEPPDGRQAELLNRLRHDCGSCHGLTLKGGLGPPLSPAAMADRDERELIEAILEGRPGTPMPPWAFELSREEAAWLVRKIKEGL